jgi:hypothetical protein
MVDNHNSQCLGSYYSYIHLLRSILPVHNGDDEALDNLYRFSLCEMRTA